MVALLIPGDELAVLSRDDQRCTKLRSLNPNQTAVKPQMTLKTA